MPSHLIHHLTILSDACCCIVWNHGAVLGLAVGSRAARLAHRVLGDVPRGIRSSGWGLHRHPCGRSGPQVPAS